MGICKAEMVRRNALRKASGANRRNSAAYARTRKGKTRQKARNVVQAAIKSGIIQVSQTCQFGSAQSFVGMTWPLGVVFEDCAETERLEAHHYLGYDEENYLSVIFLCPKHHAILEQED